MFFVPDYKSSRRTEHSLDTANHPAGDVAVEPGSDQTGGLPAGIPVPPARDNHHIRRPEHQWGAGVRPRPGTVCSAGNALPTLS